MLALAVSALVLNALILIRARRGRFLSCFPVFYCYLAYVFCGSVISLVVYLFWPQYHPNVFWFRFMITLVAEFAVLLEISDHIFRPYPALSQLGRFLTLCVSAVFIALYILPSLTKPQSTGAAIVDLVKRSSLTKAVIIVVLLAAVRYYRLPVGRNVSGIMLGFAFYLATNIVNFSLLETLGRDLYGSIFVLVGPVSYTLTLALWTMALWNYEPVLAALVKHPVANDDAPEALDAQLGRANATLVRFLRR